MVEKTQGALRRPGVGAAVAGAAVLVACVVWGASEAAVAALAAYGTYRLLRRRHKPEHKSQAPARDDQAGAAG